MSKTQFFYEVQKNIILKNMDERGESSFFKTILYSGQKKASVFVVDTVQSNQLPGMNGMYNSERAAHISKPDR